MCTLYAITEKLEMRCVPLDDTEFMLLSALKDLMNHSQELVECSKKILAHHMLPCGRITRGIDLKELHTHACTLNLLLVRPYIFDHILSMPCTVSRRSFLYGPG